MIIQTMNESESVSCHQQADFVTEAVSQSLLERRLLEGIRVQKDFLGLSHLRSPDSCLAPLSRGSSKRLVGSLRASISRTAKGIPPKLQKANPGSRTARHTTQYHRDGA